METRRQRKLHMPIGYRFCPTDEEIIIHYLRPKVLSFPLPAPAVIQSSHHHRLFLHHPATLPGDPKEKRYFFCKTSFHHHHAYASSPAGGYWKPVIKNHKLILATGCNHPIGFKKSFVFYQFSDHRPSASRTPWVLHQFHLLYRVPIKMEEWVVCSIQFKSKKAKYQRRGQSRPDLNEETSMAVVIDDDSTISNIAIGFGPQPADSPSSSGITFDNDMVDLQQEVEDAAS